MKTHISTAPVLEVTSLSKHFGELTALDKVSLTVDEGEVVAVLGRSGSGKSTLVRCIDQLEQIDAGAVYLDGELLGFEQVRGRLRPLSDKKHRLQRRRMSMVFQQFNLFPHWTVLRNITEATVVAHGLSKAAAEKRAFDLLARVELSEKAHAYPRHLSGGQQQRVAIARAVAVEPRVLFFDEPTSALDPELVGEVLQTMKDLASTGRTMMVVTHELEFAREVSNRCIFMAEGKIIEDRPSREFFENPHSEQLRTFLARSNRDANEVNA
ncbi:amino acid ABC transporter ATP-binding protein [Nesterenkonia haasae]|uniref:amino acid ABC transporter ATP-binding protein n=1 Tax=Nesterenkonia haasae TaxID=2587813 RepID=UPI002E2AA837|nr:amino acid ABC transporter ATP-binding protein [Nesterenkonia haasae]NDK31131.1 amino acid ABC transporter ATP-binding protein [Nesterenkonia haasae]